MNSLQYYKQINDLYTILYGANPGEIVAGKARVVRQMRLPQSGEVVSIIAENEFREIKDAHFLFGKNGDPMQFVEGEAGKPFSTKLQSLVARMSPVGINEPGSDKLLRNTLTNPLYGDSSGVIDPFWLDRIIEEQARYTIAKNFAMVIPINIVDKAPIRTKGTMPYDSTTQPWENPVGEGEIGLDYTSTWQTHLIEAYKKVVHTAVTWEAVKATKGKIPLVNRLLADVSEGHSVAIDIEFFASWYAGLMNGTYRKWNGTAWAEDNNIVHSVDILANPADYILYFDWKDKKTFPEITGANKGKVASVVGGTQRSIPATGATLYDFICALCSLVSMHGHKAQFVVMPINLQEILLQDVRFNQTSYIQKTKLKFNTENGYLGTIPISGSTSSIDVWVSDRGTMRGWESLDNTPYYGHSIYVGQYEEAGVIGIAEPIGLTVDAGYAVAAGRGASGLDVLRRNFEDVWTSMGMYAIKPWNLKALVLGKFCDSTATGQPWWY